MPTISPPRPPVRDHRAPVTAVPKRTTSSDIESGTSVVEIRDVGVTSVTPAVPNPPISVTFGTQTAPAPDPEPGQLPETQFQTPKRTGVVQLPSGGRFYGGAIPDGMVEVYTMTAVEDKILSELNNDNVTEIYDAILARCIKSPISPDELLDTDRFYLLLVLRSVSLGEDYTFPFECPYDKHITMHTIQIPGAFAVVNGTAEAEPFFAILKDGAKVGMRFLRGKDLRDIARFRRTNTNLDGTKGDPAYMYAHAKSLVSVNGKPFPDIHSAMDWYSKLPIRDVRILQKVEREAASGVSNAVTVQCPKCDKESVTPVALSPMYFFD